MWRAAPGPSRWKMVRSTISVCSVFDFEAVLFEGAFPAPVRADLTGRVEDLETGAGGFGCAGEHEGDDLDRCVEIAEKVGKAAAILKLGPYLDRKPKALSGGQRQRVAIGRAIVRGPKVFLFDEPLSNLDAELRVEMRVEISRLHNEIGATMIYVTHDQVEAMTMADKIVVLRAGNIEQVGSPLDVYERPATVFVAGFIGSPSMNFLDATITDGRIEVIGGQTIFAPPRSADGPVVLGLRPEQLDNSPDAGELSLEIDVVEPLGTDALVHGRLAGSGQDFTVRMPQSATSAMNDRCNLPVSLTHVHLFDPAT